METNSEKKKNLLDLFLTLSGSQPAVDGARQTLCNSACTRGTFCTAESLMIYRDCFFHYHSVASSVVQLLQIISPKLLTSVPWQAQ